MKAYNEIKTNYGIYGKIICPANDDYQPDANILYYQKPFYRNQIPAKSHIKINNEIIFVDKIYKTGLNKFRLYVNRGALRTDKKIIKPDDKISLLTVPNKK